MDTIIQEQIFNDTIVQSSAATSDIYESEKLLLVKVIAMVVLGVASFIIGIIPLKLHKYMKIGTKEHDENNLFISLMLCFGGGVLLFTTFLHLQPEVRQSFEALKNKNKIPEFGKGISISDLVFCSGFFFVYLIEEIVHMCLDRRMDHEVLHRSLSLRFAAKSHQQTSRTLTFFSTL